MSAHKTFTVTIGTSPAPDADASHDEDQSKPSSKNLLAVLDEINEREVGMLDTITEGMRACLKDIETHSTLFSNTPGDLSAQDKHYIERYNGMSNLNHALAGLAHAEQNLRTFLLQAVSQEGNVWQQRAVEAQERKTIAFQERLKMNSSVLKKALKPLRTILKSRGLGEVQARVESGVCERGIARD